MVEPQQRKTDDKGRLTLGGEFANTYFIVERIGNDELRIRRAQIVPQKYTLEELLATITPGQTHDEILTGPRVEGEAI
jgi:hypothetical protein